MLFIDESMAEQFFNFILDLLYGLSHGFDITQMAWNVNDILIFVFLDVYRYYTLPIQFLLYIPHFKHYCGWFKPVDKSVWLTDALIKTKRFILP